ncbi:MAG: endolytic transglycosylase MltG [Desulfobacteraceae bacterium]|nr:endolytic transglycosylase MltG [Desulfobacteraceae bacterium]
MLKNKSNILVLSLFIFLGTGVGVCAYFYFQISSFIKTPHNPSGHEKIFIITSGQSLKIISKSLEKESIISSKTYFKLYTKLKKAGKKIQAGEYILSASKTPEQILDILLKGKVKLYRLTLPEGLTIKEIAALVEKAALCNKTRFIDLCHDRPFIISLGIKSTSLEGYLFPDTYFFPKPSTCESIISTMVAHFNTTFTSKWQEKAKKLGFSTHEVVTLASIIEKETGAAFERPIISSVFHNRLKKNMRLESDPTVIYGIKDFDGNIKRKHLKMLTPYNTYKIKGLPIGPIANPGALSLKAALYPDKTKYLFFVSKKDTTHKFSKTIKEHNQAVRKYQLRKR